MRPIPYNKGLAATLPRWTRGNPVWRIERPSEGRWVLLLLVAIALYATAPSKKERYAAWAHRQRTVHCSVVLRLLLRPIPRNSAYGY
jgi:hypothetical protein